MTSHINDHTHHTTGLRARETQRKQASILEQSMVSYWVHSGKALHLVVDLSLIEVFVSLPGGFYGWAERNYQEASLHHSQWTLGNPWSRLHWLQNSQLLPEMWLWRHCLSNAITMETRPGVGLGMKTVIFNDWHNVAAWHCYGQFWNW